MVSWAVVNDNVNIAIADTRWICFSGCGAFFSHAAIGKPKAGGRPEQKQGLQELVWGLSAIKFCLASSVYSIGFLSQGA